MTTSHEQVIEKLQKSFSTGKTKSIQFRIDQLKALLQLLDNHEDELCTAVKDDLGRSHFDTKVMDIGPVRNDLLCALQNIERWTAPVHVRKTLASFFDRLYIHSEPLGVVLIISPWNYPVNLSLRPLVGAISAGNCALLKPSELSSNSSRLLNELIPRYLDQECFDVVLGGPAETTTLLQHKFDHIFYTGSSRVGKIVYEAAAKQLTPVTLELGGKNPLFLDDSVDIKLAAKRIIWSKFINAGQTCVAPDYILCTEAVEKQFVNAARKILDKWYPSNANQVSAYIINANHFHRLEALIDRKRVALGGKVEPQMNFIGPTIMTEVSRNHRIMKEEIFGPILPIVNVRGVNDAIDFINSKPKPLVLHVFSTKNVVQNYFMNKTSSGSLICNDAIIQLGVQALPFGGVGASGFGRAHGKSSFDTFSNKKSCMKRNYNWFLEKLSESRYLPATNKKLGIMQNLVKFRRFILF